MANIFFDGQPGPEIRAKLNELHSVFEDAVANAAGPQGWAPVLSAEADGARRVLRVTDWTGGQGAKPALLGYVGASGLVLTAALALDVRGAAGGAGPANTLAIGTVTAGAAAATITGTAPAQTLNLQLPAGAAGSAGWTPVFALASDGARRVQQVSDWTGGSGTKPATGQYVGASGLVGAIASAVDLRGTAGAGAGNVNATGTIATDDLAVFADATGNSIKSAGKKLSGLVLSTDPRLSDQRTPTAHSHTIANVTGLQAALDSKGTSNLALGTTAATALAGNTTVLPEAPADGKTYGRKNAAWVEAGGGGAVRMVQEVLTSGTSWTAPENLVGGRVKYRISGGGGSASYAAATTSSAAGAGGYCEGQAIVTAASAYTYAIGAGGAAKVATGPGNAGGDTSIFGATAYGAPGASNASPASGLISPGGSWSGGQFGMDGGRGFTIGSSGSYRAQSGANPLGTPAMASPSMSTGSTGYGSGGAFFGEAGMPGVIILEYLVSI